MPIFGAFSSDTASLSTVTAQAPPPETSTAGAAVAFPITDGGLSDAALGVIIVFSVLLLILGPSFLYLWHNSRRRYNWIFPYRRRTWHGTNSTHSYDSFESDDNDKGTRWSRSRSPGHLPPHVSFKSEVDMKSATLGGSTLSDVEMAAGSSKIKPSPYHTSTTVEKAFSIDSIRPAKRPSRDRPSRNHGHHPRDPPETSFSISNLRPVKSASHGKPSRRTEQSRFDEEPSYTSFSISQLRPPPHASISRRNTDMRPAVHGSSGGSSSDSELADYHYRTNRTVTGRKKRESMPEIVEERPQRQSGTTVPKVHSKFQAFSLSTLSPVARPSERPVRTSPTSARSVGVKDDDSDTFSLSSLNSVARPSRRRRRRSRSR